MTSRTEQTAESAVGSAAAGVNSVVITRASIDPPVGGVALRVAANVAALRRLGSVTVLELGEEIRDQTLSDEVRVHVFDRRRGGSRLQRSGSRLKALHPRRHPVASALFTTSAARALRGATAGRSPSLVVLEEVWLGRYLDIARDAGATVVYDAHNVESVLRADMGSQRRQGRSTTSRQRLMLHQLRSLETRLAKQADQVWACSEEDRLMLADLRGRDSQVCVVPNTVQVRGSAEPGPTERPALMGTGKTIVYPAMFGYQPNEEAALLLMREVLPRVHSRGLDVRLFLVGRSPTEAMHAAASGHDDIVVTGEVDDMRPWLTGADVVAVPLRNGGGTRLKILEAFAAGVPVVSTHKGAEGLAVSSGSELVIEDDMAEFARAVERLLIDDAAASGLATRAFEVVEREYSWASCGRVVEGHLLRLGVLGSDRNRS